MKECTLSLTIVLVLIFSAGEAEARIGNSSLRGSVHDAVTHHALYRVIVDVDMEDAGKVEQVATDSAGTFVVANLTPAVYVVHIRFPGYEDAVETVDLTVTSSSFLDFELQSKSSNEPAPIPPEGPNAGLDARRIAVPEKARKELGIGRQCLEKAKDLRTCVEHIKKAIKIYPDFADAHLMLAIAYIEQANAAAAKSAVDQAIHLNQRLPEAWFALGMLENHAKDYPAAERSLMEGLTLNWESPQGHYELARTYWAVGRWHEAELHALEAARIQPTMAPVHVLLGNIALRKQDIPGALKEFQQYLKLDPNGPLAEGTSTMVKKIEKARHTARISESQVLAGESRPQRTSQVRRFGTSKEELLDLP